MNKLTYQQLLELVARQARSLHICADDESTETFRIRTLQLEIKELEEDHDNLEAESIRRSEMIADLTNEVQDYRRTNNKLKGDMNSLEEDIFIYEKNERYLKETIEEEEKQNTRVIEALEQQVEKLNNQNAELERDLASVRDLARRRGEDRDEAEDEVTTLENTLDQLRRNIVKADLVCKNSDLESENKKLDCQVAELIERLKEAHEEIDTMEKQEAMLDGGIIEYDTICSLESELKKTNEHLTDLQTEYDLRNKVLDSQHEQIEGLLHQKEQQQILIEMYRNEKVEWLKTQKV